MEPKGPRSTTAKRSAPSRASSSRHMMTSSSTITSRHTSSRPMTSYSMCEFRSDFVHPNVKRRGSEECRNKSEHRKYLRRMCEEEKQKQKQQQQRYEGLFEMFLKEEHDLGQVAQSKWSSNLSVAARRLAQRARSLLPEKEEQQSEAVIQHRLEVRRKVGALFRAIRIICACYRLMKEKSMQAAEQAAGVTQLYFYSVHGNSRERGGVTLAFDKSEFSRQKGIRLPLAVRKAASKLPCLRTAADVQLVYRILNSIKSFKDKYPEDIKRRICREAWYMSCEKGRVIVRQGHLGLSFYFLFSGSAFVQLDTEDPVTGDVRSSVEGVLTAGTSFGELALLEEGGRRTVSVICREPVELFQIDRDNFREICADFYKHELNMKVDIARRYPIMSLMTPEQLKRLCFQSLIIPYPIGKVVEKDWSLAKHFYIVIEGSFQLLRELDKSTVSVTALEEATTPYPGSMLTKLSYWTGDNHSNTAAQPANHRSYISKDKNKPANHRSYISKDRDKPANHRSRSSTDRNQLANHGSQSITDRELPANHKNSSVTDSDLTGSSQHTQSTYLTVGTLRKYDHSDLRILSYRTHRLMEPVIMVSQGAKVIRVSRTVIQDICDKNQLDFYLKHEYPPPEIPDRDALMQRFIRMSHWRRFRNRVTDTLAREYNGENMAMIPETRKLFNQLKIFT